MACLAAAEGCTQASQTLQPDSPPCQTTPTNVTCCVRRHLPCSHTLHQTPKQCNPAVHGSVGSLAEGGGSKSMQQPQPTNEPSDRAGPGQCIAPAACELCLLCFLPCPPERFNNAVTGLDRFLQNVLHGMCNSHGRPTIDATLLTATSSSTCPFAGPEGVPVA